MRASWRAVRRSITATKSTPATTVASDESSALAASYHDEVRSAYLKGCREGAKKDGASAKEARTYCRATLRCLQRELSLKEFNQYGTAVGKGDRTPPHNRVVKRCAKEAVKAL